MTKTWHHTIQRSSQDARLGTELVLLVAALSWDTNRDDDTVMAYHHARSLDVACQFCRFFFAISHAPLKINGWFTLKSPN